MDCQAEVIDIDGAFSPETITLEWMPNVLIKPAGSFILLTSDTLLTCFLII